MDFVLKIGNHSHLIKKDNNIIGSENIEKKTNSIVIRNAIVSKKHAVIRKDGDIVKLIDLCSDSGTFLNGSKLNPLEWHNLAPNQLIRFGFIEAKFLVDDNNDTVRASPESEMFISRFRRNRNKSSLSDLTSETTIIASTQEPVTETQFVFGHKSNFDQSSVPETEAFIPETQCDILTQRTDNELLLLDNDVDDNAHQSESQNIYTELDLLDYEPSYIAKHKSKSSIDMVNSFQELVDSDDEELSKICLDNENFMKVYSESQKAATPKTNKTRSQSLTPEIDDIREDEKSEHKAEENSSKMPEKLQDEIATQIFPGPSNFKENKVDEAKKFDDSNFAKPKPVIRPQLQDDIATQIFPVEAAAENGKGLSSVTKTPPATTDSVASGSIFEMETQVFEIMEFKKPLTRNQSKMDEAVQSKVHKSKKSALELKMEMNTFDTETQPLLMPSNLNGIDPLNKENNANNATAFDVATQPMPGSRRLNILRTPTPELDFDRHSDSMDSDSDLVAGDEELDKEFCEMSTFCLGDPIASSVTKRKPKKESTRRTRKTKTPPAKKEKPARNKIFDSSSESDDERIIKPSRSKSVPKKLVEKTPPRRTLLSQDDGDFQTPDLLKDFPSSSQMQKINFDEINLSQEIENDDVVFNEISDDEEKQEKELLKQKVEAKKKRMESLKLKYETETTEKAKKDQEKPLRSIRTARTTKKEIEHEDKKSKVVKKVAEKKEPEKPKRTESKSSRISTRSSNRTVPETKREIKEEKAEEKPTSSRTTLKRQGNKTTSELPSLPTKKLRTTEKEPTVTLSRSLATSLKSFKIAISGLEKASELNEIKKLIGELGGAIVDDIAEASILIVSDKINLTCKVLSAITRGIPIVTKTWLEDTLRLKRLADPANYIVKDRQHEFRYKYSLRNTLQLASQKQPLKNYSIIVTSSAKPVPDEMKKIIECSGAKYYPSSARNLPRTKNLFVVADILKDADQCKQLKRMNGNDLKFLTCDDFIRNVILKQNIDSLKM